MTDSLRDRIAAAMYEQRRTVSRTPWISGWAGAHPTVQERWLSTADAVIEALGLREEHQTDCGVEGCCRPRTRYVTGWDNR